MIIPYLDSYLMCVGLKVSLGLNPLFWGEGLMEVYVGYINVVICEDVSCVVALLGRSGFQLENE